MRLTPCLAVMLPAALSVALASAPSGPASQGFAPPPPMAPGQTATPPPKGSAFIVGQVVDGSSGKPIGGALVMMTMTPSAPGTGASSSGPLSPAAPGSSPIGGGGRPAAPPGAGSATVTSSTARVLADGEGHFLFHDLPVGRVSLSATAAGYTAGNYGARRPTDAPRPITLADGQHFTDGTIRMWRLSAISGTIVDDTSEPLVDVTVTIQRFQLVNGVKRPVGLSTTQTDDRGFYHFTMNSGEFLVAVPATATTTPVASSDAYQRALSSGQADEMFRTLASSGGAPLIGGNGFRIGTMQYQSSGGLGRNIPPISADGPLLAYQTTYYPSAVSMAQAQVITLGPGDERANVDLTMRLNSTARVMGTVIGPDSTTGLLGLRLVTSDGRDGTFSAQYPTATAVTDPTGAFTFLGVPSGQYDLQATRVPRPDFASGMPSANTAPTYWARVPVTVAAADVAGVTVALRPGVRVSGHVEFDGSALRPTADRIAQGSVNLQDLDNQNQPMMPSRFSSEGQFTTQGVLPGHYLMNVSGGWSGWTLKSIVANNHDLSASPQLIEGDLSSAVVTFTDHPNKIDGAVQLPTPATDTPLVVVFFPANYQSWLENGTAGRVSRLVRLDTNGHFTLTGIPAGDYAFAAIPGDLANEWQDPKNLEAISRSATRVQIGDDDHRTIDLRPVSIR